MTYFPKTRGGMARRLRRSGMAHLRVDCPGGMQFVYLLAAGGFVKVGRARDIDKRIRQIQVGCPLEIEPVTAAGPFDKKSANAFEREMHSRMSRLRSFGEWFSCTVEQAAALFAIMASSCIGIRFAVFDNAHSAAVRRCFEREAACRDNRNPRSGEMVAEVSSLLSCFQSGKGIHFPRKSRAYTAAIQHELNSSATGEAPA